MDKNIGKSLDVVQSQEFWKEIAVLVGKRLPGSEQVYGLMHRIKLKGNEV